MKINITALRLMVGGSLFISSSLDSRFDVVLVCFPTEWCSATFAQLLHKWTRPVRNISLKYLYDFTLYSVSYYYLVCV